MFSLGSLDVFSLHPFRKCLICCNTSELSDQRSAETRVFHPACTATRVTNRATPPTSTQKHPTRACTRYMTQDTTAAAVGWKAVANTSSSGGHTSETSLQEILGITDAEADELQGHAKTTVPGYNNLVATKEGSAAAGATPLPISFASFLLDLGVKPEHVRALVLRNPTVLNRSSDGVRNVSRWLQDKLGMSRADVARLLLRFPEAGHCSVDNNLEPTVTWLRENLGTDYRGVAKMLRHAPQILGTSVEKKLEPRLRWLENRLQIPAERAAKIARNFPSLLVYSADNKFEPTLAWLQQRLGIEDESVVLAMVTTCPNILYRNTETGIEPKLEWLQYRLGLNPVEVCRIVRAHPPILSRSIEKSLEPKLAWLMDNLGVDLEEAKSMLLRCPTITGASIEYNLDLKLPWLQKTLGLSLEEAVAVLRKSPLLLVLSIEKNLDPTILFFRKEMNASDEDIRNSVGQNPLLMTYSLKIRFHPRVAALREAGVEPVFSEHYLQVIRFTNTRFLAFLCSVRQEVAHVG